MEMIKLMSLYIPRVFSNITRERITKAVEHLGVVRTIDLVGKTGSNGRRYNAAYIHFEYWYDDAVTRNFQERLTTGDNQARIIYDDPWFWIVLENNSGSKKPIASCGGTPMNSPKASACFAPVKNGARNCVDNVAFSGTDLSGLFDAELHVPRECYELVDATYVVALEKENGRLNWLLKRELERNIW
jgi:hypothetical protein